MAEIHRTRASKTFQTLTAYAQGRSVTRDDIDLATCQPQLHHLTGGNLLTFDERKVRDGDYYIIVDTPGGQQKFTGSLGGIAVGDRLFFPTELPRCGTQPLMLMKLVCPQPDYNIDMNDPKCPMATYSQPTDAAPVYLGLTEHAAYVQGAPEEHQPLSSTTQYMLRLLASRAELYFPPYVPLVPTI